MMECGKESARTSSTSVAEPRNAEVPSQTRLLTAAKKTDNVLYHCSPFKSKSARCYDEREILSSSLPALSRLTPKKSKNADDEEWSAILSAIEDMTQAGAVKSNRPKDVLAWPARRGSFRAESSMAPVPQSTRPDRQTVDDRDSQRLIYPWPSRDGVRQTFNEEVSPLRETSFLDASARFLVDSKRQHDETKTDKEQDPFLPTNKKKNLLSEEAPFKCIIFI
jgi:hypothetical protein